PVGRLPFYAALAGLAALSLFLLMRGIPETGEAALRRQLKDVGAKLDRLIEGFHVEEAREAARLPGGESWLDRQEASVAWVGKLKDRLIASLAGSARYKTPSFQLRQGKLDEVEIIHADSGRL